MSNLIPSGIKLLNYDFNNGNANCSATVYSLCPILKFLELLDNDVECPETMCWIRNYKTGTDICNTDSLVASLKNKRTKGLRISFFSTKKVKRVKDLLGLVMNGGLPLITGDFERIVLPRDDKGEIFTVYTLWWGRDLARTKPYIILSGVNNGGDVRIANMFCSLRDAYSRFYTHVDSDSEDTYDIELIKTTIGNGHKYG
jgi:hypothetical protein